MDLNETMEIGRTIQVTRGVVTDSPLYAPDLYQDGEIYLDNGWTLLDGFSGQFSYAGPIMHTSEFIGGALEDYILQHDGHYAAVVCEVLDDPDHDYSSCNPEPAGWAVAYREAS